MLLLNIAIAVLTGTDSDVAHKVGTQDRGAAKSLESFGVWVRIDIVLATAYNGIIR